MKKNMVIEIIILIAIIGVGAWFRLVNLRENPGWYTDDATHLNIAGHLLEGDIQYMAVGESTLFFARLPLFEFILAGAIAMSGHDMLTLRTLTAMLGIVTIFTLWWVTRRLTTPALAVLAALMLAIFPQAILYSRFGFSYNLLAPLVLLVVVGLTEYPDKSRWLWVAVIVIGVGSLSDLMMIMMLGPAFVVVLAHHPRELWKLAFSMLPFGVYSAVMLYRAPDSFLYDLAYTQGRLDGIPLNTQLWNITETYTVLLSRDFWIISGLIGLVLLMDSRFGKVAFLTFTLPVILLARTVPLYHLSAYYLIPLLPLIALGVAALIYRGVPFLASNIIPAKEKISVRTIPAWLIAACLVAAPLIYTVDLFAWYAQSDWITGIDPFLIKPEDAENAVNSLDLEPGDTVLVSPGVAWLLPEGVNAADFSMGPAYVENDIVYFWNDAHMPRSRFRYDPRYQYARYAIIDPLWREWGVQSIEGVAEMIAEIENEWRFSGTWGQISVYENDAPGR